MPLARNVSSRPRALAAARQEFGDLGGAEIQADARRSGLTADGLASRVRDLRSTGINYRASCGR